MANSSHNVLVKRFIYPNGWEAGTFFILSIITAILPLFFFMNKYYIHQTQGGTQNSKVYLTLFINSLSYTRTFSLVLGSALGNKKVGRRFIIETIVGMSTSIIVLLYSIICIYVYMQNITWESVYVDLLFSILLVSPCFIALTEWLYYIIAYFKINVDHQKMPIEDQVVSDETKDI